MVEGLLGKKLGMTQVFKDTGEVVAVTAIAVGPCYVTQVKTIEKDGYQAAQLGFGPAKNPNASEKGKVKGLEPLKHLKEVKLTDGEGIEVGQKFDLSLFGVGDRVDITSLSKGRGFAGGVKRHNFRGGPKTHGQSDRHRAPGSIGSGTSPGRVLRGLKMAGHMGNVQVTVQDLEVVEVQPASNVILVKGGVPGWPTNLVLVRKTKLGNGKRNR